MEITNKWILSHISWSIKAFDNTIVNLIFFYEIFCIFTDPASFK